MNHDMELVIMIISIVIAFAGLFTVCLSIIRNKEVMRSIRSIRSNDSEYEYYYEKMRRRLMELEDRYEESLRNSEKTKDTSGISDSNSRELRVLYDEVIDLRHLVQKFLYDAIDYGQIDSSIKKAINESYASTISEMSNTLKEATIRSSLVDDYRLKVADIDAIISNVLHIIRTPLSGIDISCKLIDNCDSDPGIKEESSNITGYVHMIEDGISALRSAITTSEDSITENVKDRVIHDCNLLRLTAPKKININYRFDDDDWFAEKNKLDYLLLCVNCILENAIYYTKDNGSVDIEALREGSGLKLNITNHGEPIDNQVVNRLFEKGFSSKNGSGNGLFIAKDIAERYLNGKIELTSNDENEVTFSITVKEF